jgi:beta-lactam-binding protein with PASTA domain
MRFIFGLLVGYSMRGKEKSLIITFATVAFIVYIVVPTIIFSVALLALNGDVHHERNSRPVLTKVPAIKGLSYEDAEVKLRASNLNIRLLATRYDLPLQPGLIIDQAPQPGEEVVYSYPVGVTVTNVDPHAFAR